ILAHRRHAILPAAASAFGDDPREISRPNMTETRFWAAVATSDAFVPRVALDRQSRYDRRHPEGTRMALLTVRELSVSFETRDGKVCAVNDISFSVEAGKVLALLGESGSGKSVTLRAILGLHHGANARVTGEVIVKGRDGSRLQ